MEISGVAGLRTIKNLLKTALMPAGETLYVLGGGWNVQDDGGGVPSTTIGQYPAWRKFYESHDKTYSPNDHKHETENGLDCSGFVGWTVYNVMNTKSGSKSFVTHAENMARNFANMGFGTYKDKTKVADYKPGDIMSSETKGHVFISVGKCLDGSIIFMHSSSNGVQINGSVDPNGNQNSEAVELATKYMSKYATDWNKKFPNYVKDGFYLTEYNQMRWNSATLSDPDGYNSMAPKEILADLFNENDAD
jgi:cell wall-associated NlpC family hydrolase